MNSTIPGTHSLYVRVKDSEKKWSHHRKTSFTIYQCTQPDANFSFVPGCINTPVTFTDLSTNVVPTATYDWDFNNDGIVDDHTHGSVSHQYTVPGIYQCKLRIIHNTACRDSIIKTVVFPYVHLPNDTTIYTDQTMVLDGGAGYSYLWSTGATTQTITVNGATAGLGLYTYSVTVTNPGNCNATDAINITVTLPPRDLVVESASIVPNTIPANGDSADLICLIRNTGTISAVASVVNYYLSADNILSIDDQLLGFGIVNALAAGSAETVASRQYIPPGINGQMWYILFIADGSELVVESNEENNQAAVSFFYGEVFIPANVTITNQTIVSGQFRCFNALQVITVAGAGSTFQVMSGGSAIFIAGQKISFLPGVRVFTGGYLYGYITTTNDYCYPSYTVNPLVSANPGNVKITPDGITSPDGKPADKFCWLYPNPTNGDFNLVLSAENSEWPVKVQLYDAVGAFVKEVILDHGGTHRLSLTEQAPGIYFLHIRHGSMVEMEKVIRY
jgi:PKD repeat protein